jgi:S-DNA-T family DNA segregation ATPase FtsK/SpoIIIE
MHFSPARWTAAVAAAALIALPGSVLAQSYPPQNPPAQPPAQPQAAAPAAAQVDANAAKQHLTEARDSLSQLTSMPEAAKLQGDARTKVSELISNFNALITAQSDWHASYAKVNESLTSLLGPDTEQPSAPGTAGTTGTTGAAAVQIDPALRAKLVEFRTHLSAFEKAAGGAAAAPETVPKESAPAAMPPAAATASTSNPANPATAANPAANPPASASSSTTGAVGTTGTAPAASAQPAPSASGSAEQNTNAAAQSELAAIDAILAKSKTGALTKAQTTELKRHIEALRALLK